MTRPLPALAALLVLAGCTFRPTIPDRWIRCSDDRDCPTGFTCGRPPPLERPLAPNERVCCGVDSCDTTVTPSPVAPPAAEVSAPPLPPVLEGIFTLAARHSGKCIQASGTVELQTFTCTGSPAQLLRIEEVGAGSYRLISLESQRCIEVEPGGVADGVKLRPAACRTGAEEQSFAIEPLPVAPGHVQLVSAKSGRCVDVYMSGTAEGTTVQQYVCNQAAAQTWLPTRTFLAAPHQIRVKHSGKCLEAPMGGVEQTLLRQYPCNRTAPQLFRLPSGGPGIFTLVNSAGGTCIEVPMSQLADGVSLWQGRCNGTSAQSFRIEGVGGGHDRIVSVASGKCLATADSTGGDGVAIGQFTCTGADNQRWAISAP